MLDPFVELRERILKAGIRPATAWRYTAELSDHYDDLRGELIAGGANADDASRMALARLGGQDVLVGAILADKRAYSWAGRRPWAVFLLGPVLLHLAMLGISILGLALLAKTMRLSEWVGTMGALAEMFLAYLQPAATIAVLAFLAWRQRSRAVWLIAGNAVAILIAAIVKMRVVLPVDDKPGLLVVETVAPYAAHFAVATAVALMSAIPVRRSTGGTAPSGRVRP